MKEKMMMKTPDVTPIQYGGAAALVAAIVAGIVKLVTAGVSDVVLCVLVGCATAIVVTLVLADALVRVGRAKGSAHR